MKTPVGGRMVHLPVDPDPVPEGLLVCDRGADGVVVWRAYRPGRDNAKPRYSAHWDGACKDRAAWAAERAAAGHLGYLAEQRTGNVWGTPFGPCAGCRESTRVYGPGGNPLCGRCQDVLEKWRAASAEGTATSVGPPFRRGTGAG